MRFPEPALTRVAAALPGGPGWSYEPKWDGFRALVGRAGGSGQVVSRTGHHLGSRYPELVRAAERLLPEDTIVDGEMIAVAEDGVPDFWELQRRLGLAGVRAEAEARRRPVHLVVFDLVRAEGADLLDEPLRDRRERLEALLPAAPGVQRTLHV
ncbi:MAG: ATP-dependent DNA ligase, partial [Candidatus Dormibacteraeota bacterium]|nr:ATP-dependent DNA ligase [Candidatus Dormibacteraeota bacterium]